LAVFDIENGALVLRKLAPEVSIEELRELTDADFTIGEDL